MLEHIIEFAIVLGIAAVIGAVFYFSMLDSMFMIAYGVLLFWAPFFAIPLIYYGMIKIVIHKYI